ncbi:MAG: hypothetical protein ACOC1F_08965 [Myxococcota bacterium]
MKRETGIPFVAWVGTAILAHLMWTAGAERVARVVEDFTQVRWFAESVRADVAQNGRNDSIEVTLEDLPSDLEDMKDEPDEQDSSEPEPKEPEEEPKVDDPEPAAELKPEKRKPTDPVQLVPVPKAMEEKPKPPPPVPQPKKDQRIAVEQHVKENQEDNPDARFVGDEANHVEEETVARITSHDQNDPNPTPGGQHTGPDQKPGNADETRIGENEDREGDPDEAPGEHVEEAKPGSDDAPPTPPKPAPPPPGKPEAPRVAKAEPPGGQPQQPAPPAEQPEPAPATDGPDPITADKGAYSLDPTRKKKPRAVASARPRRPNINPGQIGLGAGPNERGVKTSLDIHDVVSAVGHDELARQRAADGERRRSKHRGSWNSSSFERWRGAIENYVSSVRPGNQTALNTARVPFATYLVRIHNRLHPVFADTFLASLDALPFDNPINDYKLFARLEIVVDPEHGRIIKMGIIKTSGITAFDVGALDSVQRSGPFGKAPSAIVSSDGNVYLHWEFHRNPIYACSTMNARPYILNRPPPIDDPKKHPPRNPRPPSDPRERGVPPAGPPGREDNRSRYGWWTPVRPHRG